MKVNQQVEWQGAGCLEKCMLWAPSSLRLQVSADMWRTGCIRGRINTQIEAAGKSVTSISVAHKAPLPSKIGANADTRIMTKSWHHLVAGNIDRTQCL